MTPEGRRALRIAGRAGGLAGKGRKCSPETKIKASESITKAILEGRFHPERHGRAGYFFSSKNQKMLHYRSQLELRWYQLLECLGIIKSYSVEPFAVPYIWNGCAHNYIPDLLIEYQNGSGDLVEIRPEGKRREGPLNQAKFGAALTDCNHRKIGFMVVGYKEIEILQPVKGEA